MRKKPRTPREIMNDPTVTTISVPEASLILGVSYITAYEVIRKTGSLGEIPILRIGKRIVVPIGPLRKLLSVPEPPR